MRSVPILIAGGGPVAMTLALALARLGVQAMLVERNPNTTQHPRMDITNVRSMELFRRLGLVEKLRSVAVPEAHCFDVAWVTTMAGYELHRFRYPSVIDKRAEIARNNNGSQPLEPAMRVSQIVIEPALKRAVEAEPRICSRFGTAFEECTQDADGVTAIVRETETGQTETIRCAYLAGCDGGASRLRSCVGIQFEGQARIAQRYMVHFRSPAREMLQRWGIAWHYQSPRGTLIVQDDVDHWTLQTRPKPGDDLDRVEPDALLARFMGWPIPREILVANPWTPHMLVAEASRQGRALLLGDAAHQYDPTGGYGMNTGIADACDLAWKLTALVRGIGGPGLRNRQ
jgi:2-polyprenyl-6-methoxyphenol hydroxylase-like FAD-dependent oxidoreductase